MAETKKGTNGDKAKEVAPASNAMPSKFTKIETDREIINFDAWEEKGLASQWIQAMPLDVVKLSEATEDMGPWINIVMRLTAPIKNVSKEGDIYDVPAGTNVLVTRTFELNGYAEMALDPTNLWEVCFRTSGKEKRKGGRSIRRFELGQTKEPVAKRMDIAPDTVAKMLNRPQQAPALPPAPFE